jgi:S1-C subfamily serine protease
MKRNSLLWGIVDFALLIILLALLSKSARGQDLNVLARRNAWVTSDWSQGSGVIFKKDSVLTAAHVLGPNMKVNGKPARAVVIDTAHDLLILVTETDSISTLPMNLSPRPLQKVVTIGNPLGKNNFLSLGYVAWADGETVNTSNTVMPGYSGGGGYDENGALLGIILSGEGNCTFGFTIDHLASATRVLQFMKKHPTTDADSVLAYRATLPSHGGWCNEQVRRKP